MSQPLLRVENLTVDIGAEAGGARILDGIGFELDAGQCIGIVGESGSGKSMTALSLLRLTPKAARFAAGRIDFEGRDILAMPPDALPQLRGRDIAMVFQEPMNSLNPVMRIGDQIAEAIMLHEGLDRSARRARVLDLLRLVGIPDPDSRISAYPHEFSGGQRQRVMIAMALACTPKLLIADEPTTALDVTIQAQILDLLKQLRRQRNMAIILVSHDLGVIADIAERVLVMYCGRIVESCDIATIFTRPAHPYTEGLLRSIPSSANDGKRLYQIPGTVPSPLERPAGCAFHDRCPKRLPICRTEKPPMQRLSDTQSVACFAATPA